MIHIYPKVQIKEEEGSIDFSTKLVQEIDKKYYYWDIKHSFKGIDKEERLECLNQFHSYVYESIILGTGKALLMSSDGTAAFKLAIEQIPEKERIRNLILNR